MSQDKSKRVTMLHTRLCDLLGIEFPILSAPMGPDVSGPELVAAVSNAGGLGIIQAQFHPPPLLRQTIRRVRQLTDKPFGVNFLLHFPCEESVTVCVEERVPVLSFFWGDPSSYIARVHAVGGKVFHQVGSAAAAQAGVDVIIAQGVEAGGGWRSHDHGAGATGRGCGHPHSGGRGWRHRRCTRARRGVSTGSRGCRPRDALLSHPGSQWPSALQAEDCNGHLARYRAYYTLWAWLAGRPPQDLADTFCGGVVGAGSARECVTAR